MAFFNWTEDLSVGVAEMDEQHKILIKIINDLHDAQIGRKNNLNQILDQLVDYTKVHFAAEEKLQIQHNFPAYKLHKARHEVFVKQIVGFKTDMSTGKLFVGTKTMNFLKSWLSDHIMKEDKSYRVYLG